MIFKDKYLVVSEKMPTFAGDFKKSHGPVP